MSVVYPVQLISTRRTTRRLHGTSSSVFPSLFSLLLLFQLHITSTVGVGYMTTVAGLWGPVDVAEYAACALQAGTLYPQCWGTFTYANDISPPGNMSFWAISNGGYFVCGLLYDSHYPFCWGQVNSSAIPAQYQSTSYSNINSGGWHACAVRDNKTDSPGQVDCWGVDNSYNQSSPPSEAMISVTAGDYFSCGLSASTRRTNCWGSDITQGFVPAIQAPNASFESIYAGRYHMCGIELITQKTLCWGHNDFKQAVPPENLNFTVITGGYRFSCGLREDTHEAVCWGDYTQAQINSPAGVAFATISSGDWFTCGVTEGDPKMVVQCWGTQNDAIGIPTALKASMGLCVKQCNEGQYELQDSELGISHQCPNNEDEVCLECLPGQCNSLSPKPSVQPSNSSSRRIPTPSVRPPNSSSRRIAGIVVGVVLAVIVALIGLWAVSRRRQLHSMWVSWWKPTNRQDSVQTRLWKDKASKVISFTSEELRKATKDYDSSMVIGRGSFGEVFKGRLDDGLVVAIKKACTVERASTFDMELELLAKINHTYLVNLVGYCEEDKCLVFEFMANGSLQDCLFLKGSAQPLRWKSRMKIALQAARGLEYLHMYASHKIIHRDVKPSNILLDETWDAHISDFGLSLYGPIGKDTHLSNQTPCGTPGYIDPEYFQSYQLNSKSDVYSFGVVLLELLSGRQALDNNDPMYRSIVIWAMQLAKQGKSILILDSELKVPDDVAYGSLLEVIGLALRCVGKKGKERPTMSEVASCLQEVVEPFISNEADIRIPKSPFRDYEPLLFQSSSSSSSYDSTAHVVRSAGSSGIEMTNSRKMPLLG